MTVLAPNPGSRAPLRLEAPDPRADERRRVVLVTRESVVIARSVAGVFMRIALAPSAFQGVLLRVAGLDSSGFRYEVTLAHRDPDFAISLACSSCKAEAEAAWELWARFLQLPGLVERVEGEYETARPMVGGVIALTPGRRRRGSAVRARRARFLARRKTGRLELARPVERERELFPGARGDR